MHDSWTKHFEGEIDGRPVTVETYSEGGYRVSTTQGDDDAGKVYSDDSSTTIIDPTAKGTPVDIDGESLDEVREQLVQEGFSEQAVEKIIDCFPI